MLLLGAERILELGAIFPAVVAEAVCSVEAAEKVRVEACGRYSAGAESEAFEGVVAHEGVEGAELEGVLAAYGPVACLHIMEEAFAPIEEFLTTELYHEGVDVALAVGFGHSARGGPEDAVAEVGAVVGPHLPYSAEDGVGAVGTLEAVVAVVDFTRYVDARCAGDDFEFEHKVIGGFERRAVGGAVEILSELELLDVVEVDLGRGSELHAADAHGAVVCGHVDVALEAEGRLVARIEGEGYVRVGRRGNRSGTVDEIEAVEVGGYCREGADEIIAQEGD